MKRGLHVSAGNGVLYVPPYFSSEDGKFDVLIHYHGNVELIEQSVVSLRLNALVHIVNLGEGSDKYSAPMRTPLAFDGTMGAIESGAQRLGLERPRIRRVALSSWSAGFGALFHILSSRSRIDRVDAVFLLDSLHAGYLPGTKDQINLLGIRPFAEFARRAVAGEKLMIITHSAIETYGYADTTHASDALLKMLGLERRPVSDPAASPRKSELKIAINAFPEGERNWLEVKSEVHEGSFHLLGCKGGGKGDHVAHLAQIGSTILTPLAERWQPKP